MSAIFLGVYLVSVIISLMGYLSFEDEHWNAESAAVLIFTPLLNTYGVIEIIATVFCEAFVKYIIEG